MANSGDWYYINICAAHTLATQNPNIRFNVLTLQFSVRNYEHHIPTITYDILIVSQTGHLNFNVKYNVQLDSPFLNPKYNYNLIS